MNNALHQLQVCLKITQTQSITKGAEELHLTLLTVFIQLKNLQDQFESPLTEVIGRGIFITDFSEEIAVAAQRILYEVHAINYKTLAHKRQLIGRLKITVVSTGKYVMSYFLSDFFKAAPRHRGGIELVLKVANKAMVVESLEKNEVEFSLVPVLSENLQVENIELMENKLYLVGSREQH